MTARRCRTRPARRARLIALLALNGLLVSEATGADIEHTGLERGHRTLTIARRGGKVVTIPRPPTARVIDLAIGERTEGLLFLPGDGLDRHGAARIVARVTCRARQARQLAHAMARIYHRVTPEFRCVTCMRPSFTSARRPPRRYDRARITLDRHAT